MDVGMQQRDSPGTCLCGCGTPILPGSWFATGHDKRAQGELVTRYYGTVANLILAHEQYRTDIYVLKKPDGYRVTCPDLGLVENGTDCLATMQAMKAGIVRELEARDRRGELLHPASIMPRAATEGEVFGVTVDHPREHRPRAPATKKPPGYLYCGTSTQVSAANTEALLRSHAAIWCPPPGRIRWHVTIPPGDGDRLWLVWRDSASSVPVLLGGGQIMATPRGGLLWTNATLRGVRPAAQALGYSGPQNMAFLRLSNCVFPNAPVRLRNLGQFENGMNEATSAQANVLAAALPIP